MTVLASAVMDRAAALLSDPSKATFTYTLQLPFLRIAWDELQEDLVSSGITDVDEVTSSPISVTAGTKVLASPPTDLLFPIDLWERAVGGAEEDWVKMRETRPDPADSLVEDLEIWYWEENSIKFRGATADREVKIFYQKELADLAADTTPIPVTNCKSFLSHRTAAVIAESRGNKERAKNLHLKADYFLTKVTSTKVKDMQEKPARPRRYGWSRRRRG